MNFFIEKPMIVTTFGTHSACKMSYKAVGDSFRDSVQLSSGGDLMKMPGHLHLTGVSPHDPKWERVGTLHYLPEFGGSADGVFPPTPNAFSIECGIPLSDPKELIAAERLGHGPTRISICVAERVTFGWAPDGSMMNWDLSEKDWSPIEQISVLYGREQAPQ